MKKLIASIALFAMLTLSIAPAAEARCLVRKWKTTPRIAYYIWDNNCDGHVDVKEKWYWTPSAGWILVHVWYY